MKVDIKPHVAICANCEHPQHYNVVSFPGGENDTGFCDVSCRACNTQFSIALKNPSESSQSLPNCTAAYEGSTPNFDRPKHTVEHDLDLNKLQHKFNAKGIALYNCAITGSPLDEKAYSQFSANLDSILPAYQTADTFSVKGPGFDRIVVHVSVPCDCGSEHNATFYAKAANGTGIQQTADQYLLADVSATNLADRLEGLFSKTDVMDLLEKLLIRWHLIAQQIIIASPFVGHQYLAAENKMETWNWLLRNLDVERTIFITRKATLTGYKTALKDVEGLDHLELQRFGLESRIVSADTRKQDFHAKFFIGYGPATCEVFSGSANIVSGPSIENVSFRSMPAIDCNEKYLERFNVHIPSPPANLSFALVQKDGDCWRARTGAGSPIAR